MTRIILFALAITFSMLNLNAQKPITLEDIWQDYTFYAKGVPGFNFQKDGKHYTRLEGEQIIQYDLTTGKQTKILLDAAELTGQDGFSGRINGYKFNSDESKMLLTTDRESIYRRISPGPACDQMTPSGSLRPS